MKNWLIRTKNNFILGPVSKKKIIELIEKETIKRDDEVCSGNGYWFHIKETELVNRYLINGEVQGFNPIQEASSRIEIQISPSLNEVAKNKDLLTHQGFNKTLVNDKNEENLEEVIKENNDDEEKRSFLQGVKIRFAEHLVLNVLIVAIALACVFIYFKKQLLNNISNVSLFPSAYAQIQEVAIKKKVKLN